MTRIQEHGVPRDEYSIRHDCLRRLSEWSKKRYTVGATVFMLTAAVTQEIE